MSPLRCLLASGLLIVPTASPFAASPEDPEVVAAIDETVAALRASVLRQVPDRGYDSLAAYALFKGGLPATDRAIELVRQRVERRCASGSYEPISHHVYEAGCDLMLLEALDAEANRSRMALVVRYLARARKSSGAWTYPGSREGGESGDQSISQYAALGLWAAERGGVDVPPELWDGLAGWQLGVQTRDGGFGYHPGTQSGVQPTHSMTSAGIANLRLTALHLHGVEARTRRTPPKPEKGAAPKFGVLQKIEVDELARAREETNRKAKRPTSYVPKTSKTGIETALRRADAWFTPRFPPTSEGIGGHPYYFWYGVERMASLADTERIGEVDWYDAGVAYLVPRQPKGVHELSFKILFLANVTRELLGKKRKRGVAVASGLLAGGRGMPADLSKIVAVRDGEAEVRKSSEPLDELLAALGDPTNGETIAAQNALVEKIRLGADRDDLLEHADEILELAEHENWEVRRTAIWVVGRTENLAHADLLVEALRDENLDVAVEARNALCFLTRKPLGLGLSDDPFDGVPEAATERRRAEAAEKWKTAVHAKWANWLAEKAIYDRRDRISTADRLRVESPDR